MPAFKQGDYVSVLNEPIYGTVISCGAKKTKIKDEHGFEREYLHEKLVVVKPLENYKLGDDLPLKEFLRSSPGMKKVKTAEKTAQYHAPFEIDLHYESLYEEMNLKENYQQQQQKTCRHLGLLQREFQQTSHQTRSFQVSPRRTKLRRGMIT